MISQHTQVNLALYIGETYCEIEARDTVGTVYYKKNIFLPQTSLKSLLNQCKKELCDDSEKQIKIENIYIVTRYLEKLKSFRLGGSVIQVISEGLENNYTLQDSTQISLAATSLIIPLKKSLKKSDVSNYLASQFEKITKINPDADKVVFHLNPKETHPEVYNEIKIFFEEKDFKIFTNDLPDQLQEIRKVLLNAGTEGTKEEIIKEFNEIFPDANLYFWIKNKFTEKFENYDLFFSYSDFLAELFYNKDIKSNISKKTLNLDIENWIVLENKTQPIWNSPWGKIERTHYVTHKLSVHPLTEIYVDQNAHLQFSKNPVPCEPGPMVAGRSVKSVIIDLFFENVLQQPQLAELFPQIKLPMTQSKIQSQFKVIEHGQKSENHQYNLIDLKMFIIELITFDLGRLGYDINKDVIFGNLKSILSQKKTLKSKNVNDWTEKIFEVLKNLPDHNTKLKALI